MSLEVFDNYECEGQLSLFDIYNIPENIFAVSEIFARARKQMSLAEFKTFVYALTHFRFTEENKNTLMLDKKTVAAIVGIHSDSDHLSQDLYRSIGKLPNNSFVEFIDKDKGFYENGAVISKVRMYKEKVWLKFDEDYMSLFSKLEPRYITMWSGDIFSMSSERSIEFYEQLRLNTNTSTSEGLNHADVGIKWFKELFGIPKEGKGSYMRSKENGGFNRVAFEKYVIDPLCEDLAKCKMITLCVQQDGKYYTKLKENGRVVGYHFDWVYSAHPSVASAKEVKELQDRVDKNPQILKVAKDLIEGSKKPKTESKMMTREYDVDAIEKALLGK